MLVFQYGTNLAESPLEICLIDYQWGCEPDNRRMCLLAEDATLLESLAKWAGGGIELDADPESLAANLNDVRAAQSVEVVECEFAELRRARCEILIDYNL